MFKVDYILLCSYTWLTDVVCHGVAYTCRIGTLYIMTFNISFNLVLMWMIYILYDVCEDRKEEKITV